MKLLTLTLLGSLSLILLMALAVNERSRARMEKDFLACSIAREKEKLVIESYPYALCVGMFTEALLLSGPPDPFLQRVCDTNHDGVITLEDQHNALHMAFQEDKRTAWTQAVRSNPNAARKILNRMGKE